MSGDGLPEVDPRTLGARLREAREARGWTQQQAAEQLGVARTTVVAMEKGERRVRPEELVRLASLYGRRLSDLLQRGVPAEGFAVQLRGTFSPATPIQAELLPAIETFQHLAEDYARLEAICRAPLRRRYPPPYDVEGLDPELAGEDVAFSERRRLGLGDGPLPTLRDTLETDVGIRVFQPELPSRVAGMFAFTEDLGACVAVNLHHPQERRSLSLAHEYAHFLADRFRSEILFSEGYERRPRGERFAEAFARSFLLPAEGLRRRYLDLQRERGGGVTHGDLCRLAGFYFVSAEAMTRRLEELGLIPAGVWDRLRQEGFRVREAQRLLGIAPKAQDDELLPRRFVALAVEAWQRGELSEGQLARVLRTDRLGARDRIEELQSTASAEGGPSGPIDLSAPLLRAGSG